MHTFLLPNERTARGLLHAMFGDGTDIGLNQKDDAKSLHDKLIGVYIGSNHLPGAICTCDVPFAANVGASFSMMPQNAAANAIKQHDLSEIMIANTQEVFNICSRLLMDDSTPHLKLGPMFGLKQNPGAALGKVLEVGRGISFDVTIPNYGVGALAFVAV